MRFFIALFIAVLSFVSLAIWVMCRIWLGINYDQQIGGHLKRAADANTVEIAKQELDVALTNMERRGFTEGYTSIVYKTPDEDIGFWYANIKSARENLEKLPLDAEHLTISNELMKLRETLLDHSKNGESVTEPEGIPYHPNNVFFVVWGTLSSIVLLVALFISTKSDSHSNHRY